MIGKEKYGLTLLFLEIDLSIDSNRSREIENVPTNFGYSQPGTGGPVAVKQAAEGCFHCSGTAIIVKHQGKKKTQPRLLLHCSTGIVMPFRQSRTREIVANRVLRYNSHDGFSAILRDSLFSRCAIRFNSRSPLIAARKKMQLELAMTVSLTLELCRVLASRGERAVLW